MSETLRRAIEKREQWRQGLERTHNRSGGDELGLLSLVRAFRERDGGASYVDAATKEIGRAILTLIASIPHPLSPKLAASFAGLATAQPLWKMARDAFDRIDAQGLAEVDEEQPSRKGIRELHEHAAAIDLRAGEQAAASGDQAPAAPTSPTSEEASPHLDSGFLLQAAITPTVATFSEGKLVNAILPAVRPILRAIAADPAFLSTISPRRLEELVAAAYDLEGWDEVILTPRSGDNGCDVIATRRDFGSVRIIDQVKAYANGRRVTADEVRSLLGTLQTMPNVSKGLVTTTAEFAPRIKENDLLKPFMPNRLDLRGGAALRTWFAALAHG